MKHVFEPVVNQLQKKLFESKFSHFLAAILVLSILRNGIWVVPSIDLIQQVSINLSQNPFPDRPMAHYLVTSFLGPMLAHFLGFSSSIPLWAGFYFITFVVGFCALLNALKNRFGNSVARCVGVAFVCLPVSSPVLTWLGYTDVFTFLISTALVVSQLSGLSLFCGLLLGLNHFEQGILIVSSLLFINFLDPTREKKTQIHLLVAVAGLFCAKFALAYWFHIHQFHLTSGRLYYVQQLGLPRILSQIFTNFHALIFSFFNVFWLVIIFLLIQFKPASKWLYSGILVTLAGIAVAICVGLDTTRIYGMVTWPFVVYLLICFHQMFKENQLKLDELQKVISIAFMTAILVPPVIVWEGKVHTNVIVAPAKLLFDRVAGTHFMADADGRIDFIKAFR
jgi:hypothetical protein